LPNIYFKNISDSKNTYMIYENDQEHQKLYIFRWNDQ